jgi:ribosome-associated translation inhibitor RaiA
MPDGTVVAISFKDVDADEKVRERTEKRCRALAQEFPEPTHIEVTFSPDASGVTAHAHVTGKRTEVATSASAPALALAADRLLDRVEKQLRRAHEKRIFSHRRDAMQRNPKRGRT